MSGEAENHGLSELAAKYRRERCDAFIKEARSAKVVVSHSGDAILIGKYLIEIKSSSNEHAGFLVQALLSAQKDDAGAEQ